MYFLQHYVMTQRLSLFDTCSITNISQRSEKFWVHLVSVYVITFIVLKVRQLYSAYINQKPVMLLAC